jgi:hypothetical protein
MILAQATCGHFALFNEQEELIRQVCKCRDARYPPRPAPKPKGKR